MILGVAHVIEVATKNRKIINPNLKKELELLTHEVDPYFVVETVQFANIKKQVRTIEKSP